MQSRHPKHPRPLLTLTGALAVILALALPATAQEGPAPPGDRQAADAPAAQAAPATEAEAPAAEAQDSAEAAQEPQAPPAEAQEAPTAAEEAAPAQGAQEPPAGPDGPPPGPGEPGAPPGPGGPPSGEGSQEEEPRTGLAGWLQRMDLFQGFTISGSNTLTLQEHAIEGSATAYESQRWDTGSVVRQSSLHLEGPVWNRFAFQADISDSGWGQSYTRWVAGYMGDNTALLYGDLDLSVGGNEFAGFRKSTRGWQFDQRLPGGGLMRSFYIQEKGVVRNQTITGNDTAGPYFLTFTPVIEGSEVVKVNEDTMRFGSDYRLDYDSGQLYFEPIDGQARIISASDTISVSYQSLGYNDGGPGQIYGGRAEIPLLDDKLLLGVTMLRHDRLTDGHADDTVGYQEDIYNGSGSTGPFDTNFRPIIADGTSVVYDGERRIIDEALIVLVDGAKQVESVDYDAYRTIGRVEFRRAVPPTSLVKVQYYYEIAQTDTVAGDQDIWGVDLGWQLSKDLSVGMDWATSSTESAEEGTALSTSVDWTIGNIHTLTEYRSVDPTYAYLDTVGFQRREKGINFGLEWNFSPAISFYDRYSDLKSDTGNSFGYSGYGRGLTYSTAAGRGVSTKDTTSSALDIGTKRNDMGLDLRFEGWPTMRLERSTMSNRGGSSGSSDYTNDTLTMDYSPDRGNYTVRTTLNRTRQENITAGTDGDVLQGSQSQQFRSSVTYRPMTGLSLAASLATNKSSALEKVNDSSSRNLQLSANWMPSSSLNIELSRSLSTSDGRVSSSYYDTYSTSSQARAARAWLTSSPGGGDSGDDEEEEGETTTRPSSEDTTDSLSVSWSPGSSYSLDLSLGKRKYKSEGGQGYLSDSTQSYWNLGAMWQLSEAFGLNLGLGADTLDYLDEERGRIESQSLLVGAAYRPPGARWSANLNLNIQDGSSPTYVGYGRLQKYTMVDTHLVDLSGNLSYRFGDRLTLQAAAGVSDYDGGYSAFKKTSGEVRVRYQFSQVMALDLGFRSIKNIAGDTLDDVIYGGSGAGEDYVANTLSVSLSMNFQGGIGSGGTTGFGGPSVTGGPGTFGGYQPGLRTGGYSGTGVGSGFGTGSIGTGYGTGRLGTIGRQRTTTSDSPFGPTDTWGTTTTAPPRSGGGIAEGLGGFRGDDEGQAGRRPGTPPGASVGAEVPEDWWLLNDSIGSW